MGELANALAEVFAAILRAVGYVGVPRRRAAIREDLSLLRELDDYPSGEFGPETAPHIWLTAHIYKQVGEYSGLDFRTERRKIPWSSVFVSALLAGGLGWVTYHLTAIGEGWWAAFPAVPAALFAISVGSMLDTKEPVLPGGEGVVEVEAEGAKE